MSANKILIVDDEFIGRQLLEAILHREHFETSLAAGGRQAIEICNSFMPDLILLDVMMPEMNGFETIKELKRIPSLKTIPIILVTALGDRDSRIQGLELGANDFITKPFDRLELVSKIKNLVNFKASSNEIPDLPLKNQEFSEERSAVLEEELKEFTLLPLHPICTLLNTYYSARTSTGWLHFQPGSSQFSLFYGCSNSKKTHALQQSLLALWVLKFAAVHSFSNAALIRRLVEKIKFSENWGKNDTPCWLVGLHKDENKVISVSGFNYKMLHLSKKENNFFVLNESEEIKLVNFRHEPAGGNACLLLYDTETDKSNYAITELNIGSLPANHPPNTQDFEDLCHQLSVREATLLQLEI